MKKDNFILYFLLFLLAIFVSCLANDYDVDLFARLEVGEMFFKFHTVLKHDPFSYTPTLYWFDHEWGSGVIFYTFLKLLGTPGLIILNAILFFFSTFFILRHNKNIEYPLLTGTIILFLLNYEAGLIVRCQAFTFMFVSLTLYILEKFRHENSKLVWILPIIICFWCNLHGGVAAGLGIISVYTLLSIIQRKKYMSKLIAVCLLSYSALLVNPYGAIYIAYLIDAVTIPRDFIQDWICIFHPITFTKLLPVFLFMILLFGLKIYRNIKTKTFDIYEYCMILIIMFLGVIHAKNFPLTAIILFFFSAGDANYYLNKIKYTKNINKSLYLVIGILSLTIPLTIFTPRATWDRFPLTEVEFLKINNIKGNVIATFVDAGYISYKLFPDNKIFVDGRYDGVYPMEVFYDFIRFNYTKENWTDALEKYPTDIIIIKKREKAYDKLKKEKSSEWEEIYSTNLRGVFVKKEMAKPSYKMPSLDINYYRKNIFNTDFIKYIKKENYV